MKANYPHSVRKVGAYRHYGLFSRSSFGLVHQITKRSLGSGMQERKALNMGCDIHMIAEKKSRYDDQDTKWEPMLTPIFKDPFYRQDEAIGDWNKPYSIQPYDDRNYLVYAILAGVRNGYDIEPIAEPRGLPEDIHKISEWLLTEWDFYDHSPTWLTLEEVLAYPWQSGLTRHGVVSMEQYKVFKESGKPDEWAAAVGGGAAVNVPIEDMEAFVNGDAPYDSTKHYYTSVEWQDTFANSGRAFLENMEVLKQYGETENCDIRLVFGFDN